MNGRACQAGTVFLTALVALGAGALAATAAPQPHTVGVVDFYAPTPAPIIGGVVPETAAAGELSGLLSRAAGPDVTIVPRATMERAEAAMGWRGADVLRFGRLEQLARAVDASQLVVGWIPSFSSGGGSGDIPAPDGNGMPIAQAAVVIQVFDAAQGRIVAETRSGATTIGALPSILVEQVLREAVEPTVPWLLRTITAAS